MVKNLTAKEPALQARDVRDMGSIPVLGRSPGRGHGNPLIPVFCLENPAEEPCTLLSTGSQSVEHN